MNEERALERELGWVNSLKLRKGFGHSELALWKSLQTVMGRKLMYVNVILFEAASSHCFLSEHHLAQSLMLTSKHWKQITYSAAIRFWPTWPSYLLLSKNWGIINPVVYRTMEPVESEMSRGVVSHAQWARWLCSIKWFLMCGRHFRSHKIRVYFKGQLRARPIVSTNALSLRPLWAGDKRERRLF